MTRRTILGVPAGGGIADARAGVRGTYARLAPDGVPGFSDAARRRAWRFAATES